MKRYVITGLFVLFFLSPYVIILTNSSVQLSSTIDNTINNVVLIRCLSGQWQGSGVLVAPDLILTARHIVEGGTDFDIMTNDGKIYKATRAISSKKYDLGFIKLDVKLPCTTKIGGLEDCRLGQTVFAIGSPFGDTNFNSVTLGIISSLKRDLEKYECSKEMGWSVTFQTDTAGHPGNSGCPVFTTDGVVRGILVGGFSNVLIYCIPAGLVVNDCEMIQLMFGINEYKIEQPHDTRLEEMYEWFLQHREDSRIDELYQWFLDNKDDKRLDELYQWFLDNKDDKRLDELYQWFETIIKVNEDAPKS